MPKAYSVEKENRTIFTDFGKYQKLAAYSLYLLLSALNTNVLYNSLTSIFDI